MTNKNNLSAEIIAQLSSMQALVSKIDNEKTIMSFICKGFLDIPGIKNVIFVESSSNNTTKYDYSLEISHNENRHYILQFTFSDQKLVKQYIPYLENFCIVIGVILDERKHRLRNKEMSENLERRVFDRTKELNDEIEHRKKIEESLNFSKQQLTFALSTSKSGIFDWNITENTLYFDDNYYFLAGYQPGDFPHRYEEWVNRIHPDDVDKSLKKLEQYLQGTISNFKIEFRFKCKDNSWKWILGQAQVYSFKNGKPERIIGTHLDIDDQKKIEISLIETKQFLSSVIDSMPSVIIGITKDLYINQWNKEATNSFDISKEEALNKSIFEILNNDEILLKSIVDSLQNNKVNTLNKKKYIKNNNTTYEDITIYPLMSYKVAGAVIRIDDVTNKVFLENKILQNEKMLSISGLAAGTAHEINNPLAAIIQVSNVISNRLYKKIDQPRNVEIANNVGISLKSMKEYIELRDIPKMLNSIIDSGLRISNIVTDLLSFTANANNITSTHSITKILDQAIILATRDYILQNQFNFKNINIIKKYEENLPYISCNEVKIEQVFLNILRNAAQEMYINKIEDPIINIIVNYNKADNQLIIKIKDNGLGMSDDVTKHIFEPFYTTRDIGIGTGLGLSISYYIISENHNGELNVESVQDLGSTFIIKLPIIEHLVL